MRSRKGFTLMELVIVLVIILILVFGLVAKYGNFTDKAKDTADLSEMKTMAEVANMYLAEYGLLPTPTELLETLALDGYTFDLSEATVFDIDGDKIITARYESTAETKSNYGHPFGITFLMDYNEGALGGSVTIGTSIKVSHGVVLNKYPERLIAAIVFDSVESGAPEIVLTRQALSGS